MDFTRAFDIPAYQLKKYPQPDCLATKIKGEWLKFSTAQVQEKANQISLGLLKIGIQKNDKVAIVSMNRPEWVFADLGIQQIGAVSVPMYPTITEEDYRYIFNDAQVKAVFVSDRSLYNKVMAATCDIECIKQVYTFDEVQGANHWSELLALAKDENPHVLDALKADIKPEDLLTIIYTSGTTGNPKGVMLSHNNIVSNVKGCAPFVPVNEHHRALSFLPLCHIYERMLLYLYMSFGVSIYFAEGMETIAENLKEVKPHVFTTVPRLLEKVYDKIVAKGMELEGPKRKLFFWALELGLKYDTQQDLGFVYNAQLALANKLIFNKWREALGGNVIAIVSGGAALQARLARVFWAANIRVMEGYGLTETSPVIAVNRHAKKDNVIGTVGPPVNNVEVKIAADGEILTRGPGVMMGYYNQPKLTEEAIDQEGWFHTGDIGHLEQGKYLKITDRKKEMFKTSGGKYVAPQQIENKLKESLVIEQAMVVGEGQKFPSALIVPSYAGLQDWCRIHEIQYTTDAEMIRKPEIVEKFKKEIAGFNEHFAQYEQIKKFELILNPWTIESGELTPSLKVKRKIISKNYEDQINGMYS